MTEVIGFIYWVPFFNAMLFIMVVLFLAYYIISYYFIKTSFLWDAKQDRVNVALPSQTQTVKKSSTKIVPLYNQLLRGLRHFVCTIGVETQPTMIMSIVRAMDSLVCSSKQCLAHGRCIVETLLESISASLSLRRSSRQPEWVCMPASRETRHAMPVPITIP